MIIQKLTHLGINLGSSLLGEEVRITFVSHFLDESAGYGLSRYAYNLYHCLKEKGVTLIPINCATGSSTPLKYVFDFFVYLPLKVLMNQPKTRLYHLTYQQTGFVIPFLKKLYGATIISTIADLNPLFLSKRNPLYWIFSKAVETAAKHSDKIIAISSQTKEDLVKYFNVDESKIVVTLLGAGKQFSPLKRKKSGVFTVGYVGGFAEYKDVPFLIRAFSIFEKKIKGRCRLLLYGKGPEYQRCIKLTKKFRMENVEFEGFAPDDELPEIYNSFDVFVFPSDREGFGLPIIEAQKCFVPVIVKDKTHIPREVTDFCLKARNEEHLAELLEKIYTEGFVFTEKHKQHLEQFEWENCARKTLEVYEEMFENLKDE